MKTKLISLLKSKDSIRLSQVTARSKTARVNKDVIQWAIWIFRDTVKSRTQIREE